jgi:hypothetical protein
VANQGLMVLAASVVLREFRNELRARGSGFRVQVAPPLLNPEP